MFIHVFLTGFYNSCDKFASQSYHGDLLLDFRGAKESERYSCSCCFSRDFIWDNQDTITGYWRGLSWVTRLHYQKTSYFQMVLPIHAVNVKNFPFRFSGSSTTINKQLIIELLNRLLFIQMVCKLLLKVTTRQFQIICTNGE